MPAPGIHSWNQLLVYRMINYCAKFTGPGTKDKCNADSQRQVLLSCCKPLLTTLPCSSGASLQPLLSPNNSIQRQWLLQLMGTERRKGVSCIALPAHLSKQELLAAQKKQKGAGNTLLHCCICFQCMLPCTLGQHINVTYTFGQQTQVMLQSHSYFHSIIASLPLLL